MTIIQKIDQVNSKNTINTEKVNSLKVTMENQLLTMQQAASICGMEYETFRYWVKKELVPGMQIFGKRRAFMMESLIGWKPEKKPRGGYKGRKRENT